MPEGYWLTGKVREIYKTENNEIEDIMVETVKHGKQTREIIEFSSLRLAKSCFYNKRKEKYEFIRLGMGLRDVHYAPINYE